MVQVQAKNSDTIGGLAKAAGVGVETVRYYQRRGLLPEPPRTWDAVLELAAEGRVLWPAKPIDAFSSLVTVAANAGVPAAAEPGTFLPAEAALSALDRGTELATDPHAFGH